MMRKHNSECDIHPFTMHDIRYDCPEKSNPDRFDKTQCTDVHLADPPVEWEDFVTDVMAHVQQQRIHS